MCSCVCCGLLSVSSRLASRCPVVPTVWPPLCGPHCAIVALESFESILPGYIDFCLRYLAGIWNLAFLEKDFEDNSCFQVESLQFIKMKVLKSNSELSIN